MAAREQVHALIIKQGDHWIAQCLEYDIAAQALDFDTLRTLLMETLDAEHEESLRRHKKGFVGIDPAPKYFHDLWNHRSTVIDSIVTENSLALLIDATPDSVDILAE